MKCAPIYRILWKSDFIIFNRSKKSPLSLITIFTAVARWGEYLTDMSVILQNTA